ncbi:EAL domain-containing protein [Comamonadaceae bacterium G21597-S1]|nr:EAL domain-containing protein [Comamonadaceae bacterium G21597-S1]
MRVLIVDDAPIVRGRMARLVGNLPGVGEVLQSEDYRNTLNVIEQERPDVVLLDLFMPGGSGLELLHRIGALEPAPKVIVMSAWTEPGMRERCIDAGARCFFEKGTQVLETLDAVRHMAVEHADDTIPGGLMPEPAATDAPAHSFALPVADPANAALTVLVVEEQDFSRKVLVRQLRALGAVNVLQACDGEQALELLRRPDNAVGLILCDLDMPRMDGLEFMRHLGAIRSAASLVITGAVDVALLNSVQMMCRAYGIRPLGVLEKPVHSECLRSMMARARKPMAGSALVDAAGGPEFSLDEILGGLRQEQFEPFFQPKVELAGGRIVGAEALARWHHPQHGLISPRAFIEPLEQSGHIDTLTFMMLEQAAHACHRWNRSGHDLSVSVNLSLVSLADTRLATRVAAVVRAVGLAPRRLTLEVTETAAMTDVGPALENLARLRLRGFGLSIDDFGTGFASMQQIGRIAFSELKIDRGFVSAMGDTREARAIVESSIDIARRLGIPAVAEGIETQSEWDALRAAGCTQAQGFFVSLPVPETEFLSLCLQQAA